MAQRQRIQIALCPSCEVPPKRTRCHAPPILTVCQRSFVTFILSARALVAEEPQRWLKISRPRIAVAPCFHFFGQLALGLGAITGDSGWSTGRLSKNWEELKRERAYQTSAPRCVLFDLQGLPDIEDEAVTA